MLGKNMKHRGDTLIEVLFAITVFSLVVVGSLAIMNQGSAAAERTLEISLTRQQIDAQAETLRFLNASYIAAYKTGVSSYPSDTPAGQWQLIHSVTKDQASNFAINDNKCPDVVKPITGSFILNTRNATFVDPTGKMKSAVTFPQAQYNQDNQLTAAEGIWIEAASGDTINGSIGYIDFNIRACWDSPGQDAPVTLGTIVRLYEPRG